MGAPLTIDGDPVPIQATAGDLEWRDRTVAARRWSGDVAVAGRGGPAQVRVLPCEVFAHPSGDVTLADLDSLEAKLLSRGWLTVGGDLWGEESDAEARGVSRQEGPLETMARLSFELHERGGS